VNEGEKIKKDQVLFILENQNRRVELKKAEVQIFDCRSKLFLIKTM